MASSRKTSIIVLFSRWALPRSVPKGFSTMTRAPGARPAPATRWAIRPKSGGGTSR
jgi:hypothetical protein